MFDQLSTSFKVGSPPTKSAEMYPKVRFWTQTKYNEWTTTAEAHADRQWKVAFLEDEEGKTVSEDVIKAIRKKIRGVWADLVGQDVAPKTWGRATASNKELLCTVVYKAFPILQLSQNDWKLESLCTQDYPGWARNNLEDTAECSAHGEAKQEDKQEDNTNADNELGPGTSKKRKAKRCKSEVAGKKIKGQ